MKFQTITVTNKRSPREIYDAIAITESHALALRLKVRDSSFADLSHEDLSNLRKQAEDGLKGLAYNNFCFKQALDLNGNTPNSEAAKTYFGLALDDIDSKLDSRGNK